MKPSNPPWPGMAEASESRSQAPHDQPFHGGPFSVLWRLSRPLFLAYGTVVLLQYCLPLWFIQMLAEVVEATAHRTVGLGECVWLTAVAVLTYGLTLLRMSLERILSHRVCQGFEGVLARHRHTGIELPVLERIASRDLNLVLDGLGTCVEIVVIPAFLCLATGVALLAFGRDGLLSVSVIWLVLPLSLLLSRLSDRNYVRVMDAAAQRSEQSSAWLRDGPLLKQFPGRPELEAIEKTLAQELFWRNLDTLLRGADSYIVGFGRLLPMIVLAALGVASASSTWDGFMLWLAIPLLSAVLALPRAYQNHGAVSRALAQLDGVQARGDSQTVKPVPLDSGCLDFDRDWPIWPGSLVNLLPHHPTVPETRLAEWMAAFGLIPELGSDATQVLQRNVELNGGNLSTGQRLRVQLLRGVMLSHALDVDLLIDDDLASLDTASAMAVKRMLDGLPRIRFSDTAAEALALRDDAPAAEGHCSPLDIAAAEAPLPATGLVRLLMRYAPGIALLTLPAAMMSYAANLTLPGNRLSAWQWAAYALLGIALGVSAGLAMESRVRKGFATLLSHGLRDVRSTDTSGNLQVVSRDVTTAFERIAWYTHDIAWIVALLLCNLAALWTGFGLTGLVAATFYGLSLATIYALSIDGLYRTRRDTVGGFDALLRASQAAHALSSGGDTTLAGLEGWLERVQRAQVAEGIEHFHRTRLRSVIRRTFVSAHCTLLSDVLIVGVVMLGIYLENGNAGLVLALSALLLIRNDLSNVFLAVTGFKSQALSIDRLRHFARPCQPVPVIAGKGVLELSGFAGWRNYSGKRLTTGVVYSLAAPSGAGKSAYLKGLAGVGQAIAGETTLTTSTGVHYFDARVLALLGMDADDGLLGWLKRSSDHTPRLILIDEVFDRLPIASLEQRMEALQAYARESGDTLVVVDHRCRLPHHIELSELTR